jgi:F-type H+-transporting ATPase subunit b
VFDAPFWALVALLIFIGVAIYLKAPRTVTDALDKRAEAIRAELDQAQKLRQEAEALLADYQRKASDATAEAAGIIDQAKREAEAIAIETGKRMEEYVASRTRLAEQKISQAETQALQEVRALSADVAIAAAEKILSARVRQGAGDALVAKSIGDVRTKLN